MWRPGSLVSINRALTDVVPGDTLWWGCPQPWEHARRSPASVLYMERKGLKPGTGLPVIIAVSSALGSSMSTLEPDPVAKIDCMDVANVRAVVDDRVVGLPRQQQGEDMAQVRFSSHGFTTSGERSSPERGGYGLQRTSAARSRQPGNRDCCIGLYARGWGHRCRALCAHGFSRGSGNVLFSGGADSCARR